MEEYEKINAILYMKDNGDSVIKLEFPDEIEINLSKPDKKIILTVSNVCDALPDCDSQKLFDRFYRGDSSRGQSGGYGIGLSAARAITELYKGKISAQYQDENRITFTVVL